MNGLTGFRISPQQAAFGQRLAGRQRQPCASLLQLELAAPLSASGLEERLAACLAAHEILRTRLVPVAGLAQPIQVIEEHAPTRVAVEDLSALDAPACIARLAAFQRAERAPDGALVLTLLILPGGKQLLELAAPATHLDIASLRLVARMLLDGHVPAEPLQYADYAEWKWSLAEDDAHAGVAFWRAASANAATPLCLALEQGGQGGYAPATLELALPAALAGYGDTLPALLLAAWGGLLARLSGQGRVSLALLDESRGEGLDDALGLYEQVLPLTLEFDPARPLAAHSAVVAAARELALGWRDYYIPATPAGGLQAGPDYAFAERRGALAHERFAAGYGHGAKACLELDDTPAGPRCRLVYDRAQLDDAAAACLAEQFGLLLASVLAAPDTPLGAVPLLGAEQRTRLADQEPAPVIEPVSVLQLIARQAQARPTAPAVADMHGAINYAELIERAHALGARLAAAGVGPGVPVGILLPRGADAIVAMLAVHAAGGTYLPLDPAYPAPRRDYMIADSDIRHVITDAVLTADVAALPHRFVLGLADAQPTAMPASTAALSGTPSAATLPAVPLDAPAYLIYTSGSTGQPKAVEISQRALSHSTQVRCTWYREPVRAYLMLSSLSFDSSVAGIFWTLVQGGCLVLPAPGEELMLDRLATLIAQHRVSHGLSLPSLYQALLDSAAPDALASLACWIVAGEACPEALPARHAARLPQALLVNEYGPTEATVWASAAELVPGRAVTIGRPIPTMDLRLLNEHEVPAGIGEAGEIVLAGPTLAQGYRGQPEQTARAFVTLADGTRAYRTGDLACWQPDGELAFLGRKDHQVKLRGYRIELGEIERRLREHSDVREAAVLLREHAAGKQLVAYLVAAHGYAPAPDAIKSFLAERLPDYMVPAQVVTLDAFPRTPNGKLDAQALPDPDSLRRRERTAPRNARETTLVEVMAGVLRLPEVGITDNFFEIGGDSILSLQVVARARERGLALTAKQVFELQTVAALAGVAEAAAPTRTPAPAEPAGRFAAAGLSDDELSALIAELADE